MNGFPGAVSPGNPILSFFVLKSFLDGTSMDKE